MRIKIQLIYLTFTNFLFFDCLPLAFRAQRIPAWNLTNTLSRTVSPQIKQMKSFELPPQKRVLNSNNVLARFKTITPALFARSFSTASNQAQQTLFFNAPQQQKTFMQKWFPWLGQKQQALEERKAFIDQLIFHTPVRIQNKEILRLALNHPTYKDTFDDVTHLSTILADKELTLAEAFIEYQKALRHFDSSATATRPLFAYIPNPIDALKKQKINYTYRKEVAPFFFFTAFNNNRHASILSLIFMKNLPEIEEDFNIETILKPLYNDSRITRLMNE